MAAFAIVRPHLARLFATGLGMNLEEQRMSEALECFYSERDELLKWLQRLESEDAPLEAILEVRRELERVLRDIRRLKGGTA
ncbi:hypothetical protein [Sphingopyxis chilensis]